MRCVDQMIRVIAVLTLLGCSLITPAGPATARDRWAPQQANDWYARQPWFVGANYIPATAINELEMWQAQTFDPHRIDRELGWAEGLGMNVPSILPSLVSITRAGSRARRSRRCAIPDKRAGFELTSRVSLAHSPMMDASSAGTFGMSQRGNHPKTGPECRRYFPRCSNGPEVPIPPSH